MLCGAHGAEEILKKKTKQTRQQELQHFSLRTTSPKYEHSTSQLQDLEHVCTQLQRAQLVLLFLDPSVPLELQGDELSAALQGPPAPLPQRPCV